MNIQPSYFGDLNADVSKIIINNVYSDEIKIHENDLTNINSKVKLNGEYPASQIILQNSLNLLPKAFSLGLLSKLSRSFKVLYTIELSAIKIEIENDFKKLSNDDPEAYCIKQSITMSLYLPVLRIYYSIAPEALKNISEKPSQRNIVHRLVRPKICLPAGSKYLQPVPSWFCSFILKKNEECFASKSINGKSMDLLAQRDYYDRLPIHDLCLFYNDVEIFCETLEWLFESSTALLYINELVASIQNPREWVPPLYFLKDSKCVERLLTKGADVNVQNDEGNTVLHLWAAELKSELLLTILNKGADLTIQNKNGETALDFLLNKIFKDQDPWHELDAEQKIKTVKCLLDNGASIGNLLNKLYTFNFGMAVEKSFGRRSREREILNLLKNEYNGIFTSSVDREIKAAVDKAQRIVDARLEAKAQAKAETKPQVKIENAAKSEQGFFNFIFSMILKPFQFIWDCLKIIIG